MREIKFRAWNKANNKWEIFTNVRIELDGGVLHSHYGKDQVEYFRNCPDIEIMQYTGLKDKNGKDIYESDWVYQLGASYLVEWNELKAGFYPFVGDGLTEGDVEVKGNIYENPELLK